MSKLDSEGQKPADRQPQSTHKATIVDGGDSSSFSHVSEEPRPKECVREIKQKPGVRAAMTHRDCRSVYVTITLAAHHRTVPRHVVRPLYRRRLEITDVSPVAGRKHLRITARPAGWFE